MGQHYDKDGLPISMARWAALVGDQQYFRIDRTTVMDAASPANVLHVSTIWSGAEPPFETAVFEGGPDGKELEEGGYWDTLAQARTGHASVVAQVAAEMGNPIVMETEGN